MYRTRRYCNHSYRHHRWSRFLTRVDITLHPSRTPHQHPGYRMHLDPTIVKEHVACAIEYEPPHQRSIKELKTNVIIILWSINDPYYRNMYAADPTKSPPSATITLSSFIISSRQWRILRGFKCLSTISSAFTLHKRDETISFHTSQHSSSWGPQQKICCGGGAASDKKHSAPMPQNEPVLFLLLFVPFFQHLRPFFGTFVTFQLLTEG